MPLCYECHGIHTGPCDGVRITGNKLNRTPVRRRRMETVNGKIASTSFGIEDHGILTFFLHLEWSGGGQGLGGYALDSYDSKLDFRPGWGLGLTIIRQILETVGVGTWEKLPGTLIRIQRRGLGSSEPPIIGHIIDDRWFDLRTFVEDNKEN